MIVGAVVGGLLVVAWLTAIVLLLRGERPRWTEADDAAYRALAARRVVP